MFPQFTTAEYYMKEDWRRVRGWWSDPEKKPLIILLASASPSAGKGKPHCTVPLPTMHTAHCTVFAVYCTMHSVRCTPQSTYYSLCGAHKNPHMHCICKSLSEHTLIKLTPHCKIHSAAKLILHSSYPSRFFQPSGFVTLSGPHLIHFWNFSHQPFLKCLILLTLFFQEMVCCETIVLSSYFQILSQEALIFTRIKLLISLSSSFDCKIMIMESSFQLRQQCKQCQQSQQCQQCQCLEIFRQFWNIWGFGDSGHFLGPSGPLGTPLSVVVVRQQEKPGSTVQLYKWSQDHCQPIEPNRKCLFPLSIYTQLK